MLNKFTNFQISRHIDADDPNVASSSKTAASPDWPEIHSVPIFSDSFHTLFEYLPQSLIEPFIGNSTNSSRHSGNQHIFSGKNQLIGAFCRIDLMPFCPLLSLDEFLRDFSAEKHQISRPDAQFRKSVCSLMIQFLEYFMGLSETCCSKLPHNFDGFMVQLRRQGQTPKVLLNPNCLESSIRKTNVLNENGDNDKIKMTSLCHCANLVLNFLLRRCQICYIAVYDHQKSINHNKPSVILPRGMRNLSFVSGLISIVEDLKSDRLSALARSKLVFNILYHSDDDFIPLSLFDDDHFTKLWIDSKRIRLHEDFGQVRQLINTKDYDQLLALDQVDLNHRYYFFRTISVKYIAGAVACINVYKKEMFV